MLKINGLCKRYGDYLAVDGLNLSVEKGELFGFVGPNGAGKTTTLKIIAGLLQANAGEIYVDGLDILKDRKSLKEKIGYMPDFFGVYDNLKVKEYLHFFGSAYRIHERELQKISGELLQMVQLSGKEEAYVDELSRGMKQRLCLARALIHNPDLLILDEPASGLDPRTRYEFKEILKQLCETGKTIVISSHILMELAEMCTSIGIIQNGKILLQGNIDNIMMTIDTSNPLIIKVHEGMETAVRILKQNNLIRSLAVQGNSILTMFSGSRDKEAELLQELVTSGVMVTSFAREQSNLESLYLKITSQNETEGGTYED